MKKTCFVLLCALLLGLAPTTFADNDDGIGAIRQFFDQLTLLFGEIGIQFPPNGASGSGEEPTSEIPPDGDASANGEPEPEIGIEFPPNGASSSEPEIGEEAPPGG